MKKIALAFAALSLIAMPASVEAAPCKDAKGKFVKCPPAKPATATKPAATAPSKPATASGATKGQRCRNAKGQFAKCGTPGAKPSN